MWDTIFVKLIHLTIFSKVVRSELKVLELVGLCGS